MSDVLVVGAGHNRLVCAFYLAARGLKVKIVEKHTIVGAAVTEEFYPSFRNSVACTLINAQSEVIADLNLSAHGLTRAKPGGGVTGAPSHNAAQTGAGA